MKTEPIQTDEGFIGLDIFLTENQFKTNRYILNFERLYFSSHCGVIPQSWLIIATVLMGVISIFVRCIHNLLGFDCEVQIRHIICLVMINQDCGITIVSLNSFGCSIVECSPSEPHHLLFDDIFCDFMSSSTNS